MDKRVANEVLKKLENIADTVEQLRDKGKVNPRFATDLIQQLDSYADKFHIAAFGEESFRQHQARVLQRDKDEPWMDTFDKPFGVHQRDADESYMESYDVDQSTNVVDRDEHTIRDVSPLSNGTKRQPSWSRGPAGAPKRSYGSTKGSNKSKQWAP